VESKFLFPIEKALCLYSRVTQGIGEGGEEKREEIGFQGREKSRA